MLLFYPCETARQVLSSEACSPGFRPLIFHTRPGPWQHLVPGPSLPGECGETPPLTLTFLREAVGWVPARAAGCTPLLSQLETVPPKGKGERAVL